MTLEAVVLAVMCLHFYSRLPEKIATHFGAGGAANGWMTKRDFMFLYLGLCIFMACLFLLLPRLIMRLPDSMINLPNKDFWLAPDRRRRTIGIMGEKMAWLGVLILALFIAMAYFTFQANLLPRPMLDEKATIVTMVAFFLCMGVWLVRFIIAFRLKETPRP